MNAGELIVIVMQARHVRVCRCGENGNKMILRRHYDKGNRKGKKEGNNDESNDNG